MQMKRMRFLRLSNKATVLINKQHEMENIFLKIDEEVYKLYGLTEEEIKIVESLFSNN